MADRPELYAQAGVEPSNVSPMRLSRFLLPGAIGAATPFGHILVNEQMIAEMPEREREQALRDTLVHEQTHVRQSQRRGSLASLLKLVNPLETMPYGQRPDELEAYQAENEARAAQRLEPNPVPTFNDPRSWLDLLRGAPTPFRTRGDIPLRRQALLGALGKP